MYRKNSELRITNKTIQDGFLGKTTVKNDSIKIDKYWIHLGTNTICINIRVIYIYSIIIIEKTDLFYGVYAFYYVSPFLYQKFYLN